LSPRISPGFWAKPTKVVYAQGGFFSTSYQYLVSYKGLVFFTKSSDQILLPRDTELISAKKIWIPG